MRQLFSNFSNISHNRELPSLPATRLSIFLTPALHMQIRPGSFLYRKPIYIRRGGSQYMRVACVCVCVCRILIHTHAYRYTPATKATVQRNREAQVRGLEGWASCWSIGCSYDAPSTSIFSCVDISRRRVVLKWGNFPLFSTLELIGDNINRREEMQCFWATHVDCYKAFKNWWNQFNQSAKLWLQQAISTSLPSYFPTPDRLTRGCVWNNNIIAPFSAKQLIRETFAVRHR